MKRLSVFDLNAIDHAVKSIVDGAVLKAQVTDRIKVYKVPSSNPDKYTVRIDIKVEEQDADRT